MAGGKAVKHCPHQGTVQKTFVDHHPSLLSAKADVDFPNTREQGWLFVICDQFGISSLLC